ncbi:MAG TPA: glycerophosphodiester phosphodiesterase family protein [Blastocatellia bacterium]|jgi:glycerophosphoryl diester phosphodiesterase
MATATGLSPLVIAHRGASGHAPENTMAAFDLAVSMGATGIELDVQLAADGLPVVIHDLRVNRTTNGAGGVSMLTSEQLSRLDAGAWFDRRLKLGKRAARLERRNIYAGQAVPTLESVLERLSGAGLARIYVEIKGRPEYRERLLDAVLAIIAASKIRESITLLSFDHQAVRHAKRIAPDVRTAATFSINGRGALTARTIADRAGAAGAVEAALHFSLATRRTVEGLRERGLQVSVWTANSKLLMRRLMTRGVDAIMTNYPDRLIALLSDQPGSR